MCDLTFQTKKDLVTYLGAVPQDRRFVSDVVVLGLLQSNLLSIPEFDSFLAASTDAGRNASGLSFTMRIVNRAVIMDRLIEPKDLPKTLSPTYGVLFQLAHQNNGAVPPQLLTQLQQLLLSVRDVIVASEKRAIAASAVGPAGALPLSHAAGPRAPVLVGPSTGSNAQGVAVAQKAAADIASTDAYPEEVRHKVLYLLETWVRICAESQLGAAGERSFTQYLAVLQQQGVLTNDASMDRFFRVLMDLCVQSCAATAKAFPEEKAVSASVLAAPNTNALEKPVPTPKVRLSYTGVDALSKLVLLLLLRFAEGNHSKMQLLQKLMGIFARALIRDADINGGGCTPELAAGGAPPADARFDTRPYLRLLTNLLRDLYLPPPNVGPSGVVDENAVNEAAGFNAQVLATFANVLHLVQPARVPGFAFAWLELVSHRHFLPALLSVAGQRGWPLVHRLVIDLFRFLYPYLRRAELNEGLRLFNKGVLRIMLVLLHDFPEFLSDYAWTLLEIIPLSCLQLRNIVLIAAPTALRFCDPLDRSVPLQEMPELFFMPRVLGSPADVLPPPLRVEVDKYLSMRPPFAAPLAFTNSATPLSINTLAAAANLRTLLVADTEEVACMLNRWSMRSINALVPYLATVTLNKVSEAEGRVPLASTHAAVFGSGASELLRALIFELDPEGRYALLATIASHLRFPNTHTFFFSRAYDVRWRTRARPPAFTLTPFLVAYLTLQDCYS